LGLFWERADQTSELSIGKVAKLGFETGEAHDMVF
jgi:hypothetical protein